MADKIKEVAVEEAERIKTLASDAARSGAYLYPLRVSLVPIPWATLPPEAVRFERVSDERQLFRGSLTFSPIAPYGNP